MRFHYVLPPLNRLVSTYALFCLVFFYIYTTSYRKYIFQKCYELKRIKNDNAFSVLINYL